jgi:hypothetical protein
VSGKGLKWQGSPQGEIVMAKQKIEPQTYIEKRDELIVLAVRIANEKHGKSSKNFDGQNYVETWNRTYHTAMNRLAFESGLVGFP